MTSLQRILGVTGLLVAGLTLTQAQCTDSNTPPPTLPDLAVPPPPTPDLAMPPDFSGTTTPAVLSVLPSSGPNNAGTSITITGANFQPGASVLVGGKLCGNVNVVSDTSITCTTPVQLATCGPQDIQVTVPAVGQSATGSKLYTYTSANFTLGGINNFVSGANATMVIPADIDGDGDIDMVNVNRNVSTLTVFLNAGKGGFGLPTSYPTGTNPATLALGDASANSGGRRRTYLAAAGAGLAVCLS